MAHVIIVFIYNWATHIVVGGAYAEKIEACQVNVCLHVVLKDSYNFVIIILHF